MSRSLCVVAGATGNIGRELVRTLLERGVAVRALARRADALAALAKLGAESMAGSVEDDAFLRRALGGATTVFAMIPPNYGSDDFRGYQNRVAAAFASAIGASGIRHVVHLSSVGAQHGTGVGLVNGLHDSEKILDRLEDVAVVHLRPTFFMENHLGSIGLIKAMGTNGGGFAPDLPFPMIATRDIAAAAAELLAAPSFPERSIRELLGPRDYTMREATAALGAAIGRPDLGYVQFPSAEVKKAMLGMGLSENVADLMVEMAQGLNSGHMRPTQPRGGATDTPTTIETFARDVFAPAYRAA